MSAVGKESITRAVLSTALVGKAYTREDVEQLARQFQAACPGLQPKICFYMGTGFAGFADQIEQPVTLTFKDLPLFPDELQTPGHVPEFVMGKLCGKDIIAVRGKMFLLDGVPAQLIALPIRIAYTLGCRTLLYTNTAGAINPDYQPGDFVFLNNHINLTGSNPLVGERNGEWGPLFFDMTYPYDLGLRAAGEEVASRLGLLVQEGVYAALLGPSFETAAEIQMLAQVGADLVGMSTVMEVIAARQLGMRVLAVGFVSNMAAGLTTTLVENEEVQKTTSTRQEVYAALIKGIVERINV